MTLATLDSIRASVLGQLRAHRADVGGPFKAAENFAGNLAQGATQAMVDQIFSLAPGVLLACAGETYEIGSRAGAPVTLAGGSKGVVATSIWHVYVIALSVQAPTLVADGGITQLGIYDLASRAVAALTGLEIEGLYRSDTLTPIDSKPYWWRNNQYVWLARFSARRWIKNVEAADESAPFEAIDANVNVPATGESVTTPIVQFEADLLNE